MGGNAFNFLPANVFPRMPSAVYQSLKTRLLPQLQKLYTHVAVPAEAPEKKDHGDLDFVVSHPVHISNDMPLAMSVPPEEVQHALGAKHAIGKVGRGTSHFAVLVEKGEWLQLGHAAEEEQIRQQAIGKDNLEGHIYYQVDVNVCTNEEEWKRVVFFHGYGDLGMILGLIARNNGLLLGEKGLKIHNPPYPPFPLSEDFDDILQFLCLSMDAWKSGFRTKKEVFEWAGSTRLFDANSFKSKGEGIRKVKPDRKMYAEFVEWTKVQQVAVVQPEANLKRIKNTQVEALAYFHKQEEFDALIHERTGRAQLKKAFNGEKVREWAQLGGNWRAVKTLVDSVREECGGERGIVKLLGSGGEEELRRLTLNIKDRLQISQSGGSQ